MRVVRWMCGIKVKDRVPGEELRERLGLDDIISVQQQNSLQWYGHLLQKEEVIRWRNFTHFILDRPYAFCVIIDLPKLHDMSACLVPVLSCIALYLVIMQCVVSK